jgi:4-amino-4-deoxy-L-arabinose transferase-like glycosyltransferase
VATSNRKRGPTLWPLLLSLLVLLPAILIVVLERYDGLYGQDPFAYLDYAVDALRESLLRLQPPPPFFWPPGYPIIVALVSFVTGPVALAGQLVSLLAGALVPVFTALLAREIWAVRDSADRVVPLAAGLLVACTGQLLLWSTAVMSGTTGLAFATAGVWAAARYGRVRTARWLLLAAALLAYATLTRWIYGLVSVPVAIYVMLPLFKQRPWSRMLLHALGAALCVVVILAPVLAPAIPRLLDGSAELVPFAGNFQVYQWHPERALQREFTTADGLLTYRLPTGLYYVLAPARWSFFTVLLAPLLLPGLWAVLRRPRAATLLLVVGWAALVYAFHAGAAFQAMRHTLAYLPPLAILTAIGAATVARWLGAGGPIVDAKARADEEGETNARMDSMPRRIRPTRLALVTAVFALALGIMMAGGVHETRRLIAIKNNGLDTVRWTESQLPADARLLTFNLTSTFRHYSRLDTYELWAQDTVALAALTSYGPPLFLLVDLPSIQRQWRDRSPGLNLRWLGSGPGLTELGQHRSFTLFRVGPGDTR